MAEALDASAYIHEGFWTNWSKGSIAGVTLTLCPTYATLLTNSLALFVTLSGGQLWTILRFSLHQYRASRTPQASNVLHRQEQVILRNASTNFATLRLMSQIAWAARRKTHKPLRFCVLIVILALVHAIFFMIAGAFSNNIANAGPEVLSRSKYCGIWNETYSDIASNGLNEDSLEAMRLSVEYFQKQAHDVQLSLEYAQQCYLTQPHYYMSSTCNTMKNTTLNFKQTTTDVCPFEKDLCHADSETVVFDTGVIDSHHHLGINAEPANRLTYQRITTCAVLNDTGKVTGWDGAVGGTNANVTTANGTAYAFYGPSIQQPTDWTYSYSDFVSLFTEFTTSVTIPYQVGSQLALAGFPELGTFTPIAELQLTTADLSLMFLSFTGRYTGQVDDPWFSAPHLEHVDTPVTIAQTLWERENAISTLACKEQHQFCDHKGKCTGFLGVSQLNSTLTAKFVSGLSPRQTVTYDRTQRAVQLSITTQIVQALAVTSTPLLAMNATTAGTHVLSLHLPSNQWQIELNYWQSIAMAQLQRAVVEWGSGQVAAQPQYLIHPPPADSDKWFCKNVMILSTVYSSFNVLALGLIVGSGGLVIVISLAIEDTAAWAQKRAQSGVVKSNVRRDSWDGDDMLKLQKALRESRMSRPPPPPKDATTPNLQRGDSKSDGLQKFSSTRTLHTSVNKTPPNFSYPQPQIVPLDARGQRSYHSTPVPPETCILSRIWSDLPPTPRRDSWLTKEYDNPPCETSILKAVHIRDRDMRGFKRQKSHETLRPKQMLEISGLREHALARTQGSWI